MQSTQISKPTQKQTKKIHLDKMILHLFPELFSLAPCFFIDITGITKVLMLYICVGIKWDEVESS